MRGFLLFLASFVCLAASWTSSVSAETPSALRESTTELMVVFDPRLPASEVDQNLLDAGFPKSSRIKGLPTISTAFRMLEVSGNAGQLKAALQGVDGVVAVRPVYRHESVDFPILLNGQVIVRFEPGSITDAQVAQLAKELDSFYIRQIAGLPGAYVLQVNEYLRSISSVSDALRQDPRVRYSHPSIMFKLERQQAGGPILDPLFPFQWHLDNRGQLEGAVPGADISALEAWEVTLGEGAIVAVIDDSVQRDHEDLVDNYLTGADFIGQGLLFTVVYDEEEDAFFLVGTRTEPVGDDPSPFFGPDPLLNDPLGDFHGTPVSGIIVASANSIGVRGVAPRAGLIGIKIGLGRFATDQSIADAFLFAEANGAQVINNSWSLGGFPLLPLIPNTDVLLPDVISDTITEVATNGRGGLGVAVFFSSGNGSTLIANGNVYAAYKHTIAVGATLRDDTLACYSNYGPEQSVVAPGGGFSYTDDSFSSLFPRRNCLRPSIATTDNMQTTGHLILDFDGDGMADEWEDIVGLNPMKKFLDVFHPLFCINEDDVFCIPLVPDPFWFEDFPDPNYTRRFNGTSAACPVASGVATLVLSVNPGYRAYEVRNLIEHTADKPARINEEFNPITGHSDRYGHGRVNAAAAVQAAQQDLSWPSPVEDIVNTTSRNRIQLNWLLPDWNDDGNPDPDVAGVIVVAGPRGRINWVPEDGVEYVVGQEVAEDIEIIARGLLTNLDVSGFPTGEFDFAIWSFNTDFFYSWGRTSAVSSINPDLEAPGVSIRANPTAGLPPLTVLFTAGGVDPNDQGFVSYLWDFDDGTTSTEPAVEHTFTQPGTYVVNVEARTASGGRAFSNVIITVIDEGNIFPTASIRATPRTGPAPLSVVFEGSGTDIDGTVVAYEWDFGDGSTAIGQIVEHVYLQPGTYAATLTVIDNRGGEGKAVTAIVVTGEGTNTTSLGATAGQTAPMACGAGASAAAIATMAGLLGMTLLRRRFG